MMDKKTNQPQNLKKRPRCVCGSLTKFYGFYNEFFFLKNEIGHKNITKVSLAKMQ